MYANRPWTIRQYAGFSTVEDSNRFYRFPTIKVVHCTVGFYLIFTSWLSNQSIKRWWVGFSVFGGHQQATLYSVSRSRYHWQPFGDIAVRLPGDHMVTSTNDLI